MLELLSIMLVFIDLLARTVLFLVELFLLALGQVTVVSRHIGFLLVLDVLFTVFHARCLSRRHGAVLDKIERWHKSLKGECIRPGTPLSLEDARRLVEGYVEHYNNVRLNSAIRIHHAEGHARRASA